MTALGLERLPYDPDQVTPGVEGFVVTAIVAIAVMVLLFNFNRRVRRLNDRADIREVEPYVHCQSTHSQFSDKHGRSRVPWLSGTASWAHFTALNHILGIRPETTGLRIAPCIPKSWPGFTATRRLTGSSWSAM